MKKTLSLVLVLFLLISICTYILVSSETPVSADPFTTVKIPFPDTIKDNDSWRTVAIYQGSGEPITLSAYYDGYIWATVPVEYKDYTIEAVVPEAVNFTDIDDSDPDFFDVKWLSRTGVIRGDEKGQANIHDNITRAEAVAMVMRFMGLEGLASDYTNKNYALYKESKAFDDVTEKDWFYYVVTYARMCGIIEGDSETVFSPYRNVTREEITAMITRGLKYAGLRCPARQTDNVSDWDSLSTWGREAYDYIGPSYISDYDITDPENPVRVLNPGKAATRAEVAYVLNHTQSLCQLYPSDLAQHFGLHKEMPVIDGSTSTYPFTRALYGALFYNGETHPLYPEKHSKSHASYQRLINGEVDMLFASVYPASDIMKLAEEKGVELELIPIAYDAMIFFTNKDNPISSLTKEQISDIYVNNAYDNWSQVGGSDALLYPYCRNNDSGSHAQMEKHFLNGNEIHPDVKKETSETMSDILTDVIDAKTDNPLGYALGYSIYYYYHNMFWFYPVEESLKLLAIDGVMPTDETIADGTYPLSNNTYVVLRKDTPKDAPARKVAEFMLTEAGQNCVVNAGFGRLKTPGTETDLFTDKLNSFMPEDKNYMFSPLSIKMILSLAANGASGQTQEQLLNALGISNLDEFNNFSKDLIKRYSTTDILSLNIANSVWINKDKTPQNFSEYFKKTATEFYDAEVKSVNSSNAVKEINSWTNDKTNGKIPRIIEEGNDFWAMLINAIYFKGAWEDEFSEMATKPDKFTNADGAEGEIDFLNRTDWFSYADTEECQILELPYKNRVDKVADNGKYLGTEVFDDIDVSMYLIASDNEIKVEETLDNALSDEKFIHTYIQLSVPKFKIEYSENLNDILMDMGIVSAFKENAEFEKMFDSGNMKFTDVIHKTYISVDEKGTEAAAVTAIAMAGSALPPQPVELKFNKPFYFVIRDNISGETLFLGRFAYVK